MSPQPLTRPAGTRAAAGRPQGRRARHALLSLLALPVAAIVASCGASDGGSASIVESAAVAHRDHPADAPASIAAATLANAAYQDVEVAEAAGYASSIDTLGCFQNPEQGGMGVHYIDQSALDAVLDVRHPEALVYELDAHGEVAGLVAHEYIVPVDAWTSKRPPRLFGMELHRHPTLPLWVLHAWLWKPNVGGMHADWNPAVRQCPDGVPIFGQDLPAG